jgi:hypothetical protein
VELQSKLDNLISKEASIRLKVQALEKCQNKKKIEENLVGKITESKPHSH